MLTLIVYHREMVHIDVYVEKVISVSNSIIISSSSSELPAEFTLYGAPRIA